jgi:zinc transport system substrate-binding protein
MAGMKSTLYLIASILLIGCTDQAPSEQTGKPVVFVSIIPQAGIAKTSAGEFFQIKTLVDEGQSPHTYEPTALQLVQLEKAKALFLIGIPFEEHLLNKLVPLYPNLPIIQTDQGIERRTLPHAHHGVTCSHEHGATDPHVWLSPKNLIRIADTFCKSFEQLDPTHAATYRQNLKLLTEKLEKLDTTIQIQLAPYSGSRIYVFHPSFGYFCDAYSLQQVSVELEGKAPSPRQLVNLIEQAKEDGVQVLFVQKQFPADSTRAIADAIGGTVVPLDPLAEDSIANLRLMSDSIAQALKP